MTVSGVWLVAEYALTMPYGDEWTLLGAATGQQPLTLDWLWSQHNEHRLLLPKLIYLGLGQLSGFDFRAGPLFNVLALSGLSLLLMLAVRATRGHTRITDAVFPLALLHWGQYLNLLWGFQVTYVTSVILVGSLLTVIFRCNRQLSLRGAILTAFCLVALALGGLEGLIYVPPIACWLVIVGINRWQSGEPGGRSRGLLMVGLAVLPMVFVGLYFVDFNRSAPEAAWPGIVASVATSLQFLSNGLGPATKEIWPASGLLILAACTWSGWLLVRVYRNRPCERERTIGFLLFFAATVLLALAVGFGRAWMGPKAGFMPRYVTLAVPLLCFLYLLVETYPRPLLATRIRHTFFILMCVTAAINARKGLRRAVLLEAPIVAVEEDVRAGIPPRSLAARHCEQRGLRAPEAVLAQQFETLRKARLGPYRDLSRSGAGVLHSP